MDIVYSIVTFNNFLILLGVGAVAGAGSFAWVSFKRSRKTEDATLKMRYRNDFYFGLSAIGVLGVIAVTVTLMHFYDLAYIFVGFACVPLAVYMVLLMRRNGEL